MAGKSNYFTKRYGTGLAAAADMAADLMAGDAAKFKAGYTLDNAALAAADVFGVKADMVKATIEGRYAMDLAKRLRDAELSGDTDTQVELENEIAGLMGLDLNETEQGLTQTAADAITAFCREQGVT